MNYSNKRTTKNPKRTATSKRRINGQIIDIKDDLEKFRILNATKVMSQNNAASFPNTKNKSLDALNFIESIGCCVADKLDDSFSLIAEQTDNEILTNPNISGSQNPKNRKKLDTTKSFPNTDDPFYEVDVGRGEGEREKKATNKRLEAGTKTLRLASDIALVNVSRNYDSTLKQFKKPSQISNRIRRDIRVINK
jgi:hypothetical protein